MEGEDIPGWGPPEVVSTQSFVNALELLERERFDLVVLDVRHGAHEPDAVEVEDEAGVLALEQIQARRFVPIIFWTALPGTVRHLASDLVLVHEKTEGLPALAEAVNSLFATRLPDVNRALLRLVEDEQRRYMWDFVVNHWDELKTVNDHTAVAYLLARRLGRSLIGPGIPLLAAALGEDTSGTPPEGKVHAMEMYLRPPIPDTEIQAGDLLRGKDDEEESWWIALTPSCDLEHGKADYVLLAGCVPFEEHVDVVAWRSCSGSSGERKTAERRVVELVRQQTGGQSDRWLFLPQALDIPDLIVDMQRLTTLPVAETSFLERVASLDSPFAEAAVNRFNRYYGRIGTPDLDSDGAFARFKAGQSSDGSVSSSQAS
jgi:hypothetical protein